MKTFKAWLQPGERKIDILGEAWTLKVQREPKIIDSLPQHGECCWQDKYIYVWKTGDFQRDLDTLIHELGHAIRGTLGIEPQAESSWPEKAHEQEKKDHAEIHPWAWGLANIFISNGIE